MKETNREDNYDLLRICAAFSVVVLHVAYIIFLKYDGAGVPENCTLSVMLLNYISRFAVPCFFMLSGAFILADEKNADYKFFYRKSFKKVGITGALFCLLYVIYYIAKWVVSVFILHRLSIEEFFQRLFSVLSSLLRGGPFLHFWYLFTLIGLYVAAPFVIRLNRDLRAGGAVYTENLQQYILLLQVLAT